MFEYEGTQYTLDDLTVEATKQGLDIDTFIDRMKKLGMKEVESIENINPETGQP